MVKKSLCSLAFLLGLFSCSKREEVYRISASSPSVGMYLHLEGEQGSSIEPNQNFLKDFRASTYGNPIDPELGRFGGQEVIRLAVWPYAKKWLDLKNGDTIISPLRLSKGRSHIDLICHYLYSSMEKPGMLGGNGITLVKVTYQGKSYERHEDDGLILPLIWSQDKLQVK